MAAIVTFGVASVHEAAAARVQRVQYRQPHTVQAPAVRHNGGRAYASSEFYGSPSQLSLAGHASAGTADGSAWSAYPAWEVDCK